MLFYTTSCVSSRNSCCTSFKSSYITIIINTYNRWIVWFPGSIINFCTIAQSYCYWVFLCISCCNRIFCFIRNYNRYWSSNNLCNCNCCNTGSISLCCTIQSICYYTVVICYTFSCCWWNIWIRCSTRNYFCSGSWFFRIFVPLIWKCTVCTCFNHQSCCSFILAVVSIFWLTIFNSWSCCLRFNCNLNFYLSWWLDFWLCCSFIRTVVYCFYPDWNNCISFRNIRSIFFTSCNSNSRIIFTCVPLISNISFLTVFIFINNRWNCKFWCCFSCNIFHFSSNTIWCNTNWCSINRIYRHISRFYSNSYFFFCLFNLISPCSIRTAVCYNNFICVNLNTFLSCRNNRCVRSIITNFLSLFIKPFNWNISFKMCWIFWNWITNCKSICCITCSVCNTFISNTTDWNFCSICFCWIYSFLNWNFNFLTLNRYRFTKFIKYFNLVVEFSTYSCSRCIWKTYKRIYTFN